MRPLWVQALLTPITEGYATNYIGNGAPSPPPAGADRHERFNAPCEPQLAANTNGQRVNRLRNPGQCFKYAPLTETRGRAVPTAGWGGGRDGDGTNGAASPHLHSIKAAMLARLL